MMDGIPLYLSSGVAAHYENAPLLGELYLHCCSNRVQKVVCVVGVYNVEVCSVVVIISFIS